MQTTDSQTVYRTESQAQLPLEESDGSPQRDHSSGRKGPVAPEGDFDSQSFVLRYVVQNTLKNTPFRQLKNADGA